MHAWCVNDAENEEFVFCWTNQAKICQEVSTPDRLCVLLTRRAREIVCILWYIHFRIRLCSIMIWDDVSRRIKMIVLHQEWCDNVFTSQGEWFLLPSEEMWYVSSSRIFSVCFLTILRTEFQVKTCSQSRKVLRWTYPRESASWFEGRQRYLLLLWIKLQLLVKWH